MGIIERKKSILLNEPHLATASGSVAIFDTDLKSKLKDCKINFLPVQSGSGDPSPTNIRPITGLTGIETKHDDDLFSIVYFANNYILPTTSTHVGRVALTLEPNTTYTVSSDFPQSNYDSTAFAWGGGVLADGPNTQRNGIGTRYTRTITTDSTGILTIGIYIDNHDTTYLDVLNGSYYVKLEKGSVATEYSSTVYPISWQTEAGTLYGGYVDLTSGELVATHKMVDMGDLAWVRHQSTHYFMYSWTRDSFANTSEGFALDTFCSCYKSVNQSRFISGSGANLNYVFGTTYISSAKTNIAVRDDDYSDATAFRTSVTGQKLVYPLANPIVYQLTPQQVKAFIGRNNIWSDAGDVEVQYWKH